MKKARFFVVMMMVPALLGLAAGVYAATRFDVNPSRFDPGHTFLVQATWLDGIGCPTNAKVANPNADFTGISGTSPYTDTACPTGDPSDPHNQGLLLAKTGPTNNFTAAQAEITGVKGQTITELGFDLRKPTDNSPTNGRGSHCGAGAPRFDVITDDGMDHFIGCQQMTVTTASNGFIRLRFSGPALKVKSIFIIFDEGQDTGPDNFGLAVLDNIDVNGTLVGHGPQGHDTDGGGKGKGHDNNNNNGNHGNGDGND